MTYPNFNPEYELQDLLDCLPAEPCDVCGKAKVYTGQTEECPEQGTLYLSECVNVACPEYPDYEAPDDLNELVDNVHPLDRGDHYQLVWGIAS